MNNKFTKLLANNGWELKVNTINTWIKTFLIETNGPSVKVPILLDFRKFDKDVYPKKAIYSFSLKPEVHPSVANRLTVVNGKYRIICNLNEAGYLTAIKYVIFSKKAGAFDKQGKQKLYEQQ